EPAPLLRPPLPGAVFRGQRRREAGARASGHGREAQDRALHVERRPGSRRAAEEGREAEVRAAMPILFVGTRNAKKRREILEILAGSSIDVRDLTSRPDAPEVVEDADTFEGNARKKAVELALYLGEWTIGEDSGLVVPALDGRPGVYSAR